MINALDLPINKIDELRSIMANDIQAFDNWFDYRVCYRNSDYWEYLMRIFEQNVEQLYSKYAGIEDISPEARYYNDGTIVLGTHTSVYPEEFERFIPKINDDLKAISKKSTLDYFNYLQNIWKNTDAEFFNDLVMFEVDVDLDEKGNIVGYEYIGDYTSI